MKNKFKTVVKLISPYKKKVIAIFVVFALTAIITIVIPLLSKDLMDKGFLDKQLATIITYTILIFILTFLHQFMELIKEYLRTDVKSKITNDLYKQAVDCLLKVKINRIEGSTLRIYNDLDIDIKSISSIADDSVFLS